jgi:hypothetical protein
MTPIHRLRDALEGRFPRLSTRLLPSGLSGRDAWLMDVCLKVIPVYVRWQPHDGFTVTVPSPISYANDIEETHADVDTAFDRIARLIEGDLP